MIRIEGDRFVDEVGRTLMLRGVNLGGSSKVPRVPDGATWRADGFFEHRDVSFVGRPFPLEEADEHFARLVRWGLTFVRLLTTWEAIEHAGPGLYDEAYLTYLRAIVERAAEHGISVFIDPHQDVWSRFSGGDGAPGWTFEAVGMDMRGFAVTGAAVVHQTHGDPFPRMVWPTNYGKLANLTMWTLFFAGDDVAPRATVDGVPVQAYLQEHYIAAIATLAERLTGLSNVVGFDTLNEPSRGLLGVGDLERPGIGPALLGASPSPLQAMALGDGVPQEVDVYRLGRTGFRRTGTERIDPGGQRAWLDGIPCVWRQHGVWALDTHGHPRVLRPDHFVRINGRTMDFDRDYLRPFVLRYAAAIRRHLPDSVIFLEGNDATLRWEPGTLADVAFAPHWYDGVTLMRKAYTPWLGADVLSGKPVFGRARVSRSFARQIGSLVERARTELGGIPAIIGESGIPFDLDGSRAYATGDFSRQSRALDATMRALEAARANATLWNYTADNTNERGDQWNDEDLSIFSRDQMRGTGSLDDGGRALDAAVRPYPITVPGEVRALSYRTHSRSFSCTFRHDPGITAPALFFIPLTHYPTPPVIDAPGGDTALAGNVLTYAPRAAWPVEHTVRVRPAD